MLMATAILLMVLFPRLLPMLAKGLDDLCRKLSRDADAIAGSAQFAMTVCLTVMTGTIGRTLRKNIDNIIDDDEDGVLGSLLLNKYCDTPDMNGAYDIEQEYGGPALASEKPEGAEIAIGVMAEGYEVRFIARTFALRMIVTEEALEDGKYPQVIRAARRLKVSMAETMDIDAALMLVRMFNTNYVGGDLVPLGSASHTLPQGGTWSNVMSVPQTPSVQALALATTQIRKFPNHNGVVTGRIMPKKILCPMEQWDVWAAILGSRMDPAAGNFAKINIANQTLGLKYDDVVPNVYWNNTETNWAVQTTAENGLSFRYRRRPRSRSWVENSHEVMQYAVSARWARGHGDARSILGVEA